MACKCDSRKAAKITLWIAIPILVFSVVLMVLFPSIYNNILKKELTLTKGALLTNIWEDFPIPIYEQLYFFNITNSEDFLNGNEKLNVAEIGPYTYKSKWVKENLQWHSNNTLSYVEIRTYEFVPEMSSGTEDDIIYTFNGPMIIASNIVKNANPIVKGLLSLIFALEEEDVIIQRSIKQLSYGGYEDFIIKYAPILKPDLPYKDGKFSWLYGKNATNDGLFTVFTGVDDASKTDIIDNWNGEDRLNFWKGETCNMINGTSVEIGPAIKGFQESYTFFQTIFCRSLTFNYTDDQSHYGITVKRFEPTYEIFANGTENPDNYCFDVNGERASGVLDVSPCQFGAPVIISFPHFYLADPMYLNSVKGLDPNGEYGSHIDVEPITGISVDLSVKLQINLEIEKVYGIFQLDNVRNGIYPVFWANISGKIDEPLAHFLKSQLNNPKIIAYSVLGILAGVSLLLIVICIIVLLKSKPEEDDDPLIDANEGKTTTFDKSRGLKGDYNDASHNNVNAVDVDGKTFKESDHSRTVTTEKLENEKKEPCLKEVNISNDDTELLR